MKSQLEAILKHLRAGEKLTPLDALNAPDIRSMKLSSRIGEIKNNLLLPNESIFDEWVTTDSGKKVKQYSLVQKGQTTLF